MTCRPRPWDGQRVAPVVPPAGTVDRGDGASAAEGGTTAVGPAPGTDPWRAQRSGRGERRPGPGDQTLTVQRLGLTGSLERTLRTTNIIENLMGSVEGYTRRVKRWRGGQMIQRWVASALVEAEPRFRRVRGYRDLRYLVGALDALAPPDGAVADVA